MCADYKENNVAIFGNFQIHKVEYNSYVVINTKIVPNKIIDRL